MSFDRIPAHQSVDQWIEHSGGDFLFKVGGARPEADLVEVTVENFSSSLDHLFVEHTDADRDADAVYRSAVIVA